MKLLTEDNKTTVNTLDEALSFAATCSRELKEGRTQRTLRVFVSLTGNPFEALIAFLVWKARGKTIQEFGRHE